MSTQVATPAVAPQPRKLSFGMDFLLQIIAGATAGTAEILCMYPTDVVKTRMQLARNVKPAVVGEAAQAVIKPTIVGTTKAIAAQGYGTFYRGITAPIFAEAPKRACKFMFNEQFKKIALKIMPRKDYGYTAFYVAGSAAGVVEACVNAPFELVKIRLQSPAGRAMYTGTIQAFAKIVKDEGLLALYRGFEAQAWRNIWWDGLYFGLAVPIKEKFMWKTHSKQGELLKNFTVGFICSCVGTTMATPFDMLKTRMMDVRVTGKAPYGWAYPALMQIARQEGPKTLMRGLTMRIIRLGPGGGIMLVVFDGVYNYLKKRMTEPKPLPAVTAMKKL